MGVLFMLELTYQQYVIRLLRNVLVAEVCW